MKALDLRSLSIDDLKAKMQDLQEEHLRQRCNKVISQLPNIRLLRQGRKDIARIMTIIREKEIAAAKK